MKPKTGRLSDDTADVRLARVTDYIRATLHEPPDYRQLAQLANLSYCQLFRLFKRNTGLSPQQYIERQRLEYAKKLLGLNHLSIKEIAARVGFANQLYFSRRFQRALGLSPSHYRQNLLADPEKPLHPFSYYMCLTTTANSYGSFA
jgi:transcriptional regulator GlxA family with amidase domain